MNYGYSYFLRALEEHQKIKARRLNDLLYTIAIGSRGGDKEISKFSNELIPKQKKPMTMDVAQQLQQRYQKRK